MSDSQEAAVEEQEAAPGPSPAGGGARGRGPAGGGARGGRARRESPRPQPPRRSRSPSRSRRPTPSPAPSPSRRPRSPRTRPSDEPDPEILAAEEELAEEAIPTPVGPASGRQAKVYLCDRSHRTVAIWSAPTTCHARPTRSGGECGRRSTPSGSCPTRCRGAQPAQGLEEGLEGVAGRRPQPASASPTIRSISSNPGSHTPGSSRSTPSAQELGGAPSSRPPPGTQSSRPRRRPRARGSARRAPAWPVREDVGVGVEARRDEVGDVRPPQPVALRQQERVAVFAAFSSNQTSERRSGVSVLPIAQRVCPLLVAGEDGLAEDRGERPTRSATSAWRVAGSLHVRWSKASSSAKVEGTSASAMPVPADRAVCSSEARG